MSLTTDAVKSPHAAFDFDPFSHAVMRDPLPFYKVLREKHPAYHMPQYNAWAFSRFEDVLRIFHNDHHFHTSEGTLGSKEGLSKFEKGAGPKWQKDPTPLFGFNEPGVYAKLRNAMMAELRPKSVAAIADDIRARTNALLDALIPRKRFNLNLDFAGIVAAGSVCRMCGIPIEDAAEVLAAANFATKQDPVTGGFPPDWQQNREVLLEICRKAIRKQIDGTSGHAVPAIDKLRALDVEGRKLTVNDIATLMSSIVLGGSETLPKVFAHGLMELNNAPEQKAEVLSDLENNAAPAFEEMLRYCGPAQWFMRTVDTPIEIAGQKLERGERVIALIQSANRDDREFDNPDKFIWNRKIERHMGFGNGLHFCIGSHLARLEGKILLQEFLRRVPEYTIEEAIRTPSSFQWGYTSVTVSIP
ncbi:cytochrome P450 [Ramlibacter sp.]|uniref:cytochrome P450 n=1 Tax=Ramlibacter sp. TaxID=1917967 RepID=UPI003D0A1447